MNHNEIASRLKVKLNGISEMQLDQYKVLYDQDKSSMFSMIKKEEKWRQIFLDLYVYLAARSLTNINTLKLMKLSFSIPCLTFQFGRNIARIRLVSMGLRNMSGSPVLSI